MVPKDLAMGGSRLGGYVDASPVGMAPRDGVVTKKDCNAAGVTSAYF